MPGSRQASLVAMSDARISRTVARASGTERSDVFPPSGIRAAQRDASSATRKPETHEARSASNSLWVKLRGYGYRHVDDRRPAGDRREGQDRPAGGDRKRDSGSVLLL